MIARSAKATLAGAVFLAFGTGPAHAQLDDPTIASIVRECRKVQDETARIACYDNIPIGQPAAGPSTSPASLPPQPAAVPSAAAPPSRAAQTPGGFGSDQLPRPANATPAEPEEIVARVSAAVEREPGIYLLTLEDGAQWEFIDSVPPSYDPPRRGKTVELISASLGSYLMRYADQRAIRVRRIR
jgi:hypothetical protein